MRIALTGNPNSGKTTMYNALTGRTERVGNWAGVTVEKKESLIKKSYYAGTEELIAVDLPGAYSMSPFTTEESITYEYVKEEKPDVIINIVDATNLGRSLFFTTQLLELGIPVVVALNKSDINKKNNTKINITKLSERLNCPVMETISTDTYDNGLKKLIETAVLQAGKQQKAPYVPDIKNIADKQAALKEDRKRFAFVNKIVRETEQRSITANDISKSDKADAIITHPILGIGIFILVMSTVFYISQTTVGTWVSEWFVAGLEQFQGFVAELTEGANPFLQSLLVDGIIGGVIAVVGFLPLVMVMYFLIALLEDCGYMARATVVLDPIFKRVGLSGKSVIPMVIGVGCSIPGVMASRIIRNERERRTTAMLTPFMPCGAKLPVISLFAGAFFEKEGFVAPLMYFTGIILILLGAGIVGAVTGYKQKKSFFLIELPEYKLPSVSRAAVSMLERGREYIVKAGTIILVCNAMVHIMQNFNWSFQMVAEDAADTSILATIAMPVAVVLVPIVGVAAWQLAAAAITGFIAKENVVGTLAVCYGLSSIIDTEELLLVGEGNVVASAIGISKVAALAYLMFNLYSPPCFAAIGAMNAEMQSKKWLLGGICLQLATGFTVAFLVYQIGTFATTKAFGPGFLPGLMAVLTFALILALISNRTNQTAGEEIEIRS